LGALADSVQRLEGGVFEGIRGKGKAQLHPELNVGDLQPWMLLVFPERGAKM
jgi:hypothetical protein